MVERVKKMPCLHTTFHSSCFQRKAAYVTQDSVADMRKEEKIPRPKGKDDICIGDTVRIFKVKSVFDKE